VIQLPKILLNQIKSEAVNCYPAECCGLLIGNKCDDLHNITRIAPSPNLMKNQGNDCFEIDPQDRINIEQELRGSPNKVIGHFHSHPNQSNLPSKTDLNMAFEPELIWLIISVINGKFQDFAIYQLDESRQKYTKLSHKIVN